MTAEQLVAKKIRDMTISVKDFLTSSSLTAYLQSMLSVPCRAIKRVVPKCKTIYTSDGPLAYTDNKIIVMNAGHPFIDSCGTRVSKVRAMIGLMVHEYGHYRFTDFAGMMNAQAKLKAGRLYPKVDPDKLSAELADNFHAFTDFVEENPLLRSKIVEEWHHISNILEDAYIEECLYRTISGQLIDGLDFVRRKMKKSAITVAQMLESIAEEENNLLPCVHSLLLSYAKYGAVRCNYKDKNERNSEPMQWLRKCMPYVDPLLLESSTSKRLTGVNMVFLTLWPIIQKCLESIEISEMSEEEFRELLKKLSGDMGSEKASGSGSGAPVDPGEDTGVSGSASARKRTTRIICVPKATEEDDEPDASGKAKGRKSEEGEGSEEAAGEKGSSATESGEEEAPTESGEGSEGGEGDSTTEKADPDAFGTEPSTDESRGELEEGEVYAPDDGFFETEDDEDGGYDERALTESLTRLEREIREEIAVKETEEELTSALEKEVRETDFGTAHRGVPVTMHRISSVSDSTKELYTRIASGVESIADAMVRKILPLIKKDSDRELPMSGFFSGGKFDATRLVANDWRYFKQNATPAPDTRLALSVVVDESGSMRWACPEAEESISRIDAARNAALALYLFCQKAGIKCSVMGHSADQRARNSVELYSYADYEAVNKDDKYRLLSISARANNRDGAAVLFAGEHLLKRPEPTKLMVIISDGAPLAAGYSGLAAETDLANIVNELRRKGVIVFAAAIGGDKENIQRIYDSGFVDISNLSELPDQLLQLVRRYIR